MGFSFTNFNTSHVTVYRCCELQTVYPLFISIHLMLLFIRSAFSHGLSSTVISIHLMLLFIRLLCWLGLLDCYFNTSHVTVYLKYQYKDFHTLIISIHLMLLFIGLVHFQVLEQELISIHLMLLFICILYSLPFYIHHFNTSHVTVYLRRYIL